MIADHQEYDHAKAQLAEQRKRLDLRLKGYVSRGLNDDEVERLMQPLECFYVGKLEEIKEYEKGLGTR
ncbi:hypothetical protein [Rhodopirellula sallentina]|uniref:Uncharacterized protein n=1 Tax=Rhodopirellula sallentina SM41 TaxID=1263870 RepID=M5UG14_9BACT|nr:hypothetical protein [Rhodopirellula sallentina]EMI54953.1 hypothetical protein RSSM_03619 [Rhodopirellula sallentina SM41]